MSLKSQDEDETLAEELEERVDEALDEGAASVDDIASAFRSD